MIPRINDPDPVRRAERERQLAARVAALELEKSEKPKEKEKDPEADAKAEFQKLLNTRSGGVYMPPARLRALQAAAAFILMSSASMTDVVEALGATLLSSLVTIPAEYFEYRAHSALLEGVNAKLSQLWRRLWRWYVIVLAASFVLALLLGTSQAGMSILLAAALAASVLLRLIKAALLLLSAKAAKRV